MQSWEPFNKSKAGFCYFLTFLSLQVHTETGICQIKQHKRPSHNSTNECCIYKFTNMVNSHVHFNPFKKKKRKSVVFILNKALMLHSNRTPSTMLQSSVLSRYCKSCQPYRAQRWEPRLRTPQPWGSCPLFLATLDIKKNIYIKRDKEGNCKEPDFQKSSTWDCKYSEQVFVAYHTTMLR